MSCRFVLVAVLTAVSAVSAQEIAGTATLPRFDAASVKLSDPGAMDSRSSTRPGQYLADNIPLSDIVARAFDVPPNRITGAPGSLWSQRFSITARMPAGAPDSDRSQMIRALLIDRFKLRYRVNTREGDGYELAVSGQGGRLGPQLRAVKSDCVARRLAGEPTPPECRYQARSGSIDVSGYPVSTLANALAALLDAVVVDRTGLAGNFEFTLQWARQSIGAPSATSTVESGSQGPSLFTALEEQLGLRLRSTRLPIEYVLIEHIERPDPD